MDEEASRLMDGVRRLRACRIILGDANYRWQGLDDIAAKVSTELRQLEGKLSNVLPPDFETDR